MRGLNKITVLDFSKLLPGPLCTMLLADMGCRVVKVELPYWPDPLRNIGAKIDGHGFMYWMSNRNKESLCLDFRKPAGHAALMKLIAKADVVVEGFRPGMMRKLGLGHKTLRRKFPRLVYCSLTGYGQTGPMSRRAGHDINFLAESGFMGAGDSNGAYSFPATQVADLCGSHTAANAILAALLDRSLSGKGRYIDVSMTEAAFSWLVLPLGYRAASGKPYRKDGPFWWTGKSAFYRLYRTKDRRWLCVAAVERPFAEALLRELGRKDLIAKLVTMDVTVQGSFIRTLERIFKTKTLRQWESRLSKKDVCVTPVRTLEEALGIFQRPPSDGVEPLVRGKELRSPIRFSPEDYRRKSAPPRLGKHSVSVLRSYGLAQKEIRKLEASGLLKKG